jgi:hypothetical protein
VCTEEGVAHLAAQEAVASSGIGVTLVIWLSPSHSVTVYSGTPPLCPIGWGRWQWELKGQQNYTLQNRGWQLAEGESVESCNRIDWKTSM